MHFYIIKYNKESGGYMYYDLIVLGGGPAGYLAAERAGKAGMKTLLIEERAIGGVCLNEGCIPTKTMLHSAKIYDYARLSEKYGVTTEHVSIDHTQVLKRKQKVVKLLTSGINSQLKASNVDLVMGRGYIVKRDNEGVHIAAGDHTYICKHLLIATGSSPIIPPIPGVEDGLKSGLVMTSREILDLATIPQSLVVIGGGVIGLEMASYFNSVGSQVTVIEMLDHIGGQTDKEIAEILLKNYQKKGITFHLEAKVTEITSDGLYYTKGNQHEFIPAERILLSVGRRPNTQNLGLENIGVQLDGAAIKVDEYGATTVPRVYAAGDVNGRSMLAHTAYREAEVCVNHMLGKADQMRYHAIPAVIYTNPEVASVGETEATATAKGIDFTTAKISMRYSGRYVAENEGGDGICKVLIDNHSQKLIGVHLISNYASEIIYGAAAFIESEMKVEDIRRIVFPHPTVSEIIREAMFSL